MNRSLLRALSATGCLAVAIVTVAAGPPAAGRGKEITLERMFSTPAPWGTAPAQPAWSRDGSRVAFLWNDKGDRFLDLWVADPASATLKRVTDLKEVRPDPPADDKRTDEEKATDQKLERGVSRLAWSPDSRHLAFVYAGDLWLADASATARPKRITHTAAAEDQPTFSPDGTWLAYRSGGDLWLSNLASPEIIQLTRLAKGRDVSVTDYSWSPVAPSRIAFVLRDQSKVGDSPIPNYLSADGPSLNRPKRVFPGKEGAALKIGVVAAPEGGDSRVVWIDTGGLVGGEGFNARATHWSPDGTRLLIDRVSRDQKHRWLLVADVPAGAAGDVKAREIFHETDITNYWGPVLLADWTRDGRSILFVSDRDGDYHLYRMAAEGGEPVQLTRGPWQITSLEVPEKGNGKAVYFAATMAAPSETQLYRVDVGGGAAERVTQSTGSHQAIVSPDGSRYATVFSSDLEAADLFIGEVGQAAPARRLTHSALPEFAEYAWIAPKYVTFPSRKDGVTVHAKMLVPPTCRPGAKCALVMGSVYNNRVRNSWSAGNAFDQYLAARHGFIVMTVDIRASTPYGRKFRQDTINDLGGVDLEDLISGVEYLNGQGYIDRERVGVWGWSYGGFMTLMAMFKAPDVFKVGVAGAPVSNWAHDTEWVVPLLGTPKDNPEAYKRTSPITYADRLQGHLLIVQSMGDERVLFEDTVALVDKLLMAKKDVDVVFAPRGGHGYDPRDEGQLNRYKRIAAYFVEHLGASSATHSTQNPEQ